MDAKYLMVDQPLHDVEDAQPVRTSPKWKLQFGASRPCCQALIAAMEAARTRLDARRRALSVVVDRPTRALTVGYDAGIVDAATVASPPSVNGAHAPARRSSSGEMNTCIGEPASWPRTRQRPNGQTCG
jgi:hypothetical protein